MKQAIIIFLLLSTELLYAQHAEQISFIESKYDFGTIKEADGPVTHEFKFTNNGTEPITILNVKASCGCTTPGWTREAVEPGETGFIQAQYNPRNRPGRFNKTLTVNNNLGSPIRLYISGVVTPRPRSMEESYPKEMGAIRMKTTSLNMGKVFVNREPVTRKFELINQSDSSVLLLDKYINPKYIVLAFETDTLAPKATTNVMITYDAAVKDDLGFMNDNVSFYTLEGGAESKKELTIYATLEEYFAPMTKEQRDNAPKLTMEEILVDLGRLNSDEKIEREVEIVNSGKSDLIIKKVSPNCTCLTGDIASKKIKPGESSQLKLVFDATGRRGNQQKSVTLYSNDPAESAKRVTVKVYIDN